MSNIRLKLKPGVSVLERNAAQEAVAERAEIPLRNSVCLGKEDMGECQQADDLEPWWRSVDGGTAIWRSWLEELTLSDIIHRVGGPIAAVGSHFTVPVAHIADYYPSHHG